MTINEICTLITTIAGVIPTIVTVVILVVNIIKNKDWNLVQKIAREAMATVEEYAKSHPELKGDDKLNMALEAIKSGLAAANVNFDEKLMKKTIEYIKSMIGWSNSMN